MKKLRLVAVLSLVVITSIVMVACKNNDNGNGSLNPTTEARIKQDYLQQLNNGNIALEDILIHKYYGTYGDSVAVIMAISGVEPPPAIDEMVVADFEFTFNTGRHITIWNNGIFYTLHCAYDGSFITIGNLETIHNLHKA